jgi:hypothetical protein
MRTTFDLLRRKEVLWFAACLAFAAIAAPSSAADFGVPAGADRSLRESGRSIVSVVAVDIDADGDIDVVATDTSLDLLVLVNDGTGRFSRKPPAPHQDVPAAAPPGVESHQPRTDAFTPPGPVSFAADVRATTGTPPLLYAVVRIGSDPAIDRSSAARRPRGPPIDSSLT